jgi:hypothetical protein
MASGFLSLSNVRLMGSKFGVNNTTKAALKARFLTLNPFTLKTQLDAKLNYILNNARCTDL